MCVGNDRKDANTLYELSRRIVFDSISSQFPRPRTVWATTVLSKSYPVKQGENSMITNEEMDPKVVLLTLRLFAVFTYTYGDFVTRRTQ